MAQTKAIRRSSSTARALQTVTVVQAEAHPAGKGRERALERQTLTCIEKGPKTNNALSSSNWWLDKFDLKEVSFQFDNGS